MVKVIENRSLGEEFFLLTVDIGGNAIPGQFYMIRPTDQSKLLGRPISLFSQNKNTTTFLIAEVGGGTANLRRVKIGEQLDIFGPFGNGFLPPEGEKIYLVGGGTGIAPFHHMLAYWPRGNFQLAIGMRELSTELEREYEQYGEKVQFFYGGYVTDFIDFTGFDRVYTCGPMAMMEAVFKKAEGIPTYISLEKRMGCGFGACLGCTTETKEGRKTVCKEGPVFLGEEILCL